MSDRGALDPAQEENAAAEVAEELVSAELPVTESADVQPAAVEQAEEEKSAKGSKEDWEPAVDPSGQLAERIRQSEALPAGLRSRLAELVLAKDAAAAEAAVRAVEASLPGILRIGSGEVNRQEHPAGEAFFYGDPEQMAEAQAEQIARGQLARSGLLRGQRARAE